MEIHELKKLPISHLILIILDEKNNSYLRKFADIELKIRIKHLGTQYDDLMQSELKVINKRGLDIENYLFSKKTNMQLLMELYFNEVYNTKFEESTIMFSERHLCTDMNFMAKFFDKICDLEIANLSRRIDSKYLDCDKHTLILFRRILEQRKQEITEERKMYKGLEILEFNSAFNYLDDNILFSPVSNISDEEFYRMETSKLQMLKYIILTILDESIFDYDIFGNLYGMKKILEDSSKLSTQRKILLSQAKSGFKVDYDSENMQKVKQKAISSLK